MTGRDPRTLAEVLAADSDPTVAAIGRELAQVDAEADPLSFRPFEPRTVGGGDGLRRYAVVDVRTGERVWRGRRWVGAVDEARQRNDAHEETTG